MRAVEVKTNTRIQMKKASRRAVWEGNQELVLDVFILRYSLESCLAKALSADRTHCIPNREWLHRWQNCWEAK